MLLQKSKKKADLQRNYKVLKVNITKKIRLMTICHQPYFKFGLTIFLIIYYSYNASIPTDTTPLDNVSIILLWIFII